MLETNNINNAFNIIINEVKNKTNIDYEEHLLKILAIDIITLNHDRHLENLTFLQDGKNFKLASIFDHGCSFDNEILKNGDCRNRLSTFLKKGKNQNDMLYSLNDYLSLFKNRKCLLKLSNNIYDVIENYNNDLYTPYEVKQCKLLLLDRLKETEGILWEKGISQDH